MSILYSIITMAVPVMLAIIIHEIAHGYVALLLGDKTAWLAGRLTLNPIKHIDPIGSILIPALLILAHSPFLFGWAKPVPVNFQNLRHPKRDMVWVAAAGPAINIVLAILSTILLAIFSPDAHSMSHAFLLNSVLINIALAIFNLMPIPPFDGGRIAIGVLPYRLALPLSNLEQYGMFIGFGMAFFVMPLILNPVLTAVAKALSGI